MIFVKDVHSTVYPKLEDVDSSPTTKYIRENVREVKEEFNGKESKKYVYDEYQYTADEFCLFKTEENSLLKKELDEMKVTMTSLLSLKDGE